MLRKYLLSCIIVAALDASAFGQEQCVSPTAPPVPDGAKATRDQIVAAQTAIKAFAAAADKYQACVVGEIARQKELAKQNNVDFDLSIEAALTVKAVAQRKDAERIASAWGAAVQAFTDAQQKNQRRPGPTAPPPPAAGYGTGRY